MLALGTGLPDFELPQVTGGRLSSSAVDPRLERIGEAIDAELPLELLDPEPFVELPRPPRLGRFSRYWRDAEAVVWEGYSPTR